MAKLVILVLDDIDKLHDVLTTWGEYGAKGVTVIESTGMARLLTNAHLDDLPLFPDLLDLLRTREVHHKTLFSVIDDDVDLNELFDATERLLGPLDSDASGIMLACPVLATRGLHRPEKGPNKDQRRGP